MRRLLVALTFLLLTSNSIAAQPDRLPDALDPAATTAAARGTRGWSIRDIVELRLVTDLSISEDERTVAFVVKQSFIDTADIRFGLYVASRDGKGFAHKLAESSYMADLSRHPGTALWTVRANFGRGVQLYDIDAQGKPRLLVENSELSPVGGNLGLIRSSHEGPRDTGVVAYEWSPDGTMLWYTRLRLRPPAQLQSMYDAGLVYDPDTMSAFALTRKSNPMMGTELHVIRIGTPEDRLLVFLPLSEGVELMAFEPGLTQWSADGRSIRYRATTQTPAGEREFIRWSADVASGVAKRLPQPSASETVEGATMPDGGFIAVRPQGDSQHLVRFAPDGTIARDYGSVRFSSVAYGTTPWWDAARQRGYLAVHYRDHDGLIALAPPPGTSALEKIPDHLSECSFTRDLAAAACLRESLTLAPEVVEISPRTGRLTVLARPNAQFDAIQPLRSERREWTNRFGSSNDGYVTYPRGYVAGHRYPTLVVTHGGDARNRFAYFGFQWDHPIQVLAESGYLVLSVNDPVTDSKTRAARDSFLTGSTAVDVEQMQFFKNVNPVASMEAAVQWAIDAGMADPDRTGIAGYSRGCEVVEFALAHSKMFKVGADGDAGGWNPGGYWDMGMTMYRALYRGMYGGSPYDRKALSNYEKYSPAFYTSEFAGPLLQQFAMSSGTLGLELNALLHEGKVPTELVLYPDETHLFWQPRHRAAAMATNLDWFNYWLSEERDPDPAKQSRYARWDRMRQDWKGGRR
jgi:dipeptidyl aminopeptidase/acylaminoacyl peptidase